MSPSSAASPGLDRAFQDGLRVLKVPPVPRTWGPGMKANFQNANGSPQGSPNALVKQSDPEINPLASPKSFIPWSLRP